MEGGGGEEEGVGFVVQSRDLTIGRGDAASVIFLSLSLNRRSFPEADLLLSSSLPHTWKKTYRQVLSLFPRTEFFFKKSLNMNF